MKYDLEFVFFDIKIKKWFYIIILILHWGIVLPFLLDKAKVTIIKNLDYSYYFNELQIFVCFLLICSLFVFIRQFIDNDQFELINSIDHRLKIRFLLYYFFIYQFVLLPIYIITFSFFPYSISIYEICNLIYQQVFVFMMFYFLAYFIQSSFSAFGIVLGYLFVFSTLLRQPMIMNIFHLDFPLEYVPIQYYILNILVIFIFLRAGTFLERRFL